MNYSQNYYGYIARVKTLNRSKTDEKDYYENHHILPRCCGGADSANNLVLLTAREHFLAHYLLTKIYKDTPFNQGVSCAFILMCKPNKRLPNRNHSNSRLYEAERKEYSQLVKLRLTGIPQTLEARKNAAMGLKHSWALRKIKNLGPTRKHYGPLTDQLKTKISIAHIGQKLSEDHKLKISRANMGHPPTFCRPRTAEEKILIGEKVRKSRLEQGQIRSVFCIDTGEVFRSITEAAAAKGLRSCNIIAACKGATKTCGKLHWEYIDETRQE